MARGAFPSVFSGLECRTRPKLKARWADQIQQIASKTVDATHSEDSPRDWGQTNNVNDLEVDRRGAAASSSAGSQRNEGLYYAGSLFSFISVLYLCCRLPPSAIDDWTSTTDGLESRSAARTAFADEPISNRGHKRETHKHRHCALAYSENILEMKESPCHSLLQPSEAAAAEGKQKCTYIMLVVSKFCGRYLPCGQREHTCHTKKDQIDCCKTEMATRILTAWTGELQG